MKTINVHDAKTHFSKLLEQVAAGDTVVIAKAGTPVAKLSPLDSPSRPSRTGFLRGRITVPDDFNTMGDNEITASFE